MSGAQKIKDQGNAAFKKQQYAEAITLYTQAMSLDPSDFILPNNRALAFLKINKPMDAERDATKSLDLQLDNNPKAFYRRYLARKTLGKLSSALKDLEEAIKQEPANESMKKELEELKVQVQEKMKAKAAEESKQPAEERPVPKMKPRPRQESPVSESDDFMRAVSTRKLDKTTPPSVTASNPSAQIPPTATNDFMALKAARDRSKAPAWKQTPPATTKPAVVEVLSTTRDMVAKESKPTQKVRAPVNAFEFERSWSDKKDAGSRWAILDAICEAKLSIPTLFRASLSPDLLDQILEILSQRAKGDGQHVLHLLQGLSETERFDINSAMCSKLDCPHLPSALSV